MFSVFLCHQGESVCSETWDLLLLKYLSLGKIQDALLGSQKLMAVIKQRAGYPWLVMKENLDILWSIGLLLQLGVSLKSFLEIKFWKNRNKNPMHQKSVCEDRWDLLDPPHFVDTYPKGILDCCLQLWAWEGDWMLFLISMFMIVERKFLVNWVTSDRPRMWAGVVSKDLRRAKCAQLTCYCSATRWLAWWVRGEQFILTCVRFLILYPITSLLTSWQKSGLDK